MVKRRRKPARRKRGGRSWLVLALVGAAVFAAGLYLGGGKLPRNPLGGPQTAASGAVGVDSQASAPESRHSAGREPATAPRPGAATPPSPEPVPAPESGARIALVIDDLGRSIADIATLADLDVPLSYAVLPFESMTAGVVAAVRERKGELLCHLPMDPRGANNPGPGALHEGMTRAELQAAAGAALDAVPGAIGVNNHMGSELSADAAAMRAILGVLQARQLFYLDSRTSLDSRGYATALELGIPAAERQVFLDTDPRQEAVVQEWHRLLAVARERGAAIAIGHPHPQTLAVLQREVPRARRLGYEFVPVSYLLDRAGELPE